MPNPAIRNDRRQTVGASFSSVAQWISQQCGRPSSFILACAAIVVWAVLGPVFGYSDTWQLIINTGTTIVTFLMVFLIQNTQNRDMSALHLKLDELIRVSEAARNSLLTLEDMTEEELARLKGSFSLLAAKTTESELPRSDADGVETAADEIQQAKRNVTATENGEA
jgi:low affinity Fe/Cu permease